MTAILQKITQLIILICLSSLCYSQSNEIKVTFLGNCGLHITDGNLNIYSDFPYKSGAYNYMEYDSAVLDSLKDSAIFLFTHKHADHYSKKLVKNVIGKTFGPWNADELGALSTSIPDFKIEAFKTKHRFSLNHYSYLITWHGKTIFLSGDTESAATIGEIKEINWAFVPYWILLDANEKGVKINAEKFGLYHLYPQQKINIESPDTIIKMNEQGEVLSIPY